jgi:hypothetical protein
MESKQEPVIIQVNVVDYRGKCPNCLKDITANVNFGNDTVEPDQHKDYVKYKQITQQRFQEYSLPLCYYCWTRNCEQCEGCALPMGNLAFSSAFGSVLMVKTTIAPGDWKLHICDVCTENGYTGELCDCARCKRQQEKLCTL